jgi:hypothetical protein
MREGRASGHFVLVLEQREILEHVPFCLWQLCHVPVRWQSKEHEEAELSGCLSMSQEI